MARTVTLLQLRTDIAYQADIVTGTTGRYTTAMLNRFINQSIQRFRERISNEGIQHYLVSSSGSIGPGASSGVPFATLDMSAFSPAVVRTYGLDVVYQNTTYSLTHRPFTERAIWGGPEIVGMPQSWAHFKTDQVAVMPAPDQAYPYTMWYLPLLADLSADGDTFDGVAGWEDFIVWDVTCRVINRDQYANAYAIAVAERDRVWADILRSATKVSAAGGAVIGRDTFGDVSKRFPQKRIVAAGNALPPAGSVTNAMLASMPQERLKGRARAAGDGSPQDLTPIQAAGAVAVYSGTIAGLVPSGPGNSTTFLRADGSWAAPAGGGGGGTPGGPTGSVQFNQGSGAFGGASGLLFDGSTLQRFGDMIFPTGSVIFGAPSGAGTGTAGSGLVRFPYGTDLLRSRNASGTETTVVSWGAGGNLNRFQLGNSPQGNDAVESWLLAGRAFGHRANNVLKLWNDADKLSLSDGHRLGIQQLAHAGVTDKLGAVTPSGFVNIATGVNVTGSGVGLDLAGLTVASLSAPLFGIQAGLVPTSSSAGLFLRDDGTWQTPAGGGGGGGATVGAPTLSFQFNAGSGMMLGATGVKMAGSGIGINAVAITVASLSAPIFSGTRAGLVPTATSAGLFLRDDATWASVPTAAATGLTKSQLANMPPLTFRANPSGVTGVGEDISVRAAASMLPLFNASGTSQGLLFAPTGGVTGRWLRDDGTWQGVPTAAATGVGAGPTMLAAGPPFSVQYNGGSGFAGASGLLFDGSTFQRFGDMIFPTGGILLGSPTGIGSGGLGNLPGSGLIRFPYATDVMRALNASGIETTVMSWGAGGNINRFQLGNSPQGTDAVESWLFASRALGHRSGNVLRLWNDADKLSLSAGHRLGLQQLAHGATDDKLGAWTASGFANVATGVNVTGSGVGLDLRGLTVASLSAPLFGVRPGLVPTSSSAGLFLRDDGTWQTPAGGGGGGGGSIPGLPTLAFQYNAGSGMVAGATGVKMMGSGLGIDAVAITVASLSAPVFSSTNAGLVPTATSSNLFLRDDGTWAAAGGGASSGIANNALAPMPPFTFKGNGSGASGFPQDLTMPQAASMLPLFFATGGSPGLVAPPTGGASGYFLGDDGAFFNIIPRMERDLGNIGSGVGSGFVVGSATIDFTTDPYQELNLFGRTQFTLTPPSRHRHVQLRMTTRASGHSPTFYGTMVKWMGGSGAAPAWNTGSGIVNFANFFYDGAIMWGNAGVGAG